MWCRGCEHRWFDAGAVQRLAWAGLFTIEVQPAILQRVVETVASGSTLIVVRLNLGHRNRCKYDKTVRG